jgi:hypothetical protein
MILLYCAGNSDVTIDHEASRFVQNDDAQDDVIEVLDEHGVVVLTGGPGGGKTFQGQAVLRHYRQKGYAPYTLTSLREWHGHVGPDRKSVVLLDHTLGDVFVDEVQYKLWRALRPTVIALTARATASWC